METIQITFFGPANSGKSSLVNALAGQQVALVSPVPGTTTDPVRKRMELPGLGPCVLVDTAGFDDAGVLGAERKRLTSNVIDHTDIAVLLLTPGGSAEEKAWAGLLHDAAVSVIPVAARADLLAPADIERIRSRFPDAVAVSAVTGSGLDILLQRLAAALPDEKESFLTGALVQAGDHVVLVMPQDSEAPKGRLILPQVNVLRELLDRGCIPHCCTPETLRRTLDGLTALPRLVITDSQAFKTVEQILPEGCPLTSFSVLLAAAKGDVRVFVAGAAAIDTLQPDSRVLIAEACTHVPAGEDIGRVKIPALLRKKAGESLRVDIAAGNDFPDDLSVYSLIIHCGACVATKRLVRARTRKALLAGVPITNYGIALAKLQGILDRIVIP